MSPVTSIRLSLPCPRGKGCSDINVVEMGLFGLVFKIGFGIIFGLVLETIPLQQGLKGLDLIMEEEQGWDNVDKKLYYKFNRNNGKFFVLYSFVNT